MRTYVTLALLPLTLACSFDGTGVNTEGPASSAATTGGATETTSEGPGTNTTGAPTTTEGSSATTSTSGPGSEVTGEPLTTEPVVTATEPEMTGPMTGTTGTTGEPGTTGTTGEPDTSTSSDTGDSSSSSTTSDTTGAPGCDKNSFQEKLLVLDAMVIDPMKKYDSNVGEGKVAYSVVANDGTVSFTFDMPCDGEVAVWGRVLDDDPGPKNGGDPDSFYARVDGEGKTTWRYGCQTSGMTSGYHWLRVRSMLEAEMCNQAVPWMLELTAGAHTLYLDNREAATQSAVAAVARVIITTDLDYVPLDSE